MENYTVYLDAETTTGDQVQADIVEYTAIFVRDKDHKIIHVKRFANEKMKITISNPYLNFCY